MRVPMEDKMKILIAGDGKVGASLTRELTAAGYDITLIDSKQLAKQIEDVFTKLTFSKVFTEV